MSEFEKIAIEVARMVDVKNEEYGECYKVAPELLKLFMPDGISSDKYEDIAIVLRLIEKVARLLGPTTNTKDIWADIIGLGLNGYKNVSSVKVFKLNNVYTRDYVYDDMNKENTCFTSE